MKRVVVAQLNEGYQRDGYRNPGMVHGASTLLGRIRRYAEVHRFESVMLHAVGMETVNLCFYLLGGLSGVRPLCIHPESQLTEIVLLMEEALSSEKPYYLNVYISPREHVPTLLGAFVPGAAFEDEGWAPCGLLCRHEDGKNAFYPGMR